MQADILKRVGKIFLFQLASRPSECFSFSLSHFLSFYFFPLLIIGSCCAADGQKCQLRGCRNHRVHPSTQAIMPVPAKQFVIPVSAYISQGQTSQKPPALRYEEIYCYSFSETGYSFSTRLLEPDIRN